MEKIIKVKYLNDGISKLEKTTVGDWIDLSISNVSILNSKGVAITPRINEGKFIIKQHDIVVVDFGVAMELPEGYEALIASRSSLFKKHGLILTNSIGIVDNAYRGNEDEWKGIFLATKYTHLEFNERICQFRIQENMPSIIFEEVDNLEGESRGGYGSTDVVEPSMEKAAPGKAKKNKQKAIEKVVDSTNE